MPSSFLYDTFTLYLSKHTCFHKKQKFISQILIRHYIEKSLLDLNKFLTRYRDKTNKEQRAGKDIKNNQESLPEKDPLQNRVI